MRTQSLRQFANRQIKMDRQGKYLYRKHRAYVIHKMMLTPRLAIITFFWPR